MSRDASQSCDEMTKTREPLVLCEPPNVSSVYLLGDDGDLECAEDVVKEHVR